MTTERRTEASVKTAVESLEGLLNAQSDKTLSDLDRLEQSNRMAIERISTMNQAAGGLATDSEFLKENNLEILKYVKQVDVISDDILRLERFVKEMDEWSRELAIKVKRL